MALAKWPRLSALAVRSYVRQKASAATTRLAWSICLPTESTEGEVSPPTLGDLKPFAEEAVSGGESGGVAECVAASKTERSRPLAAASQVATPRYSRSNWLLRQKPPAPERPSLKIPWATLCSRRFGEVASRSTLVSTRTESAIDRSPALVTVDLSPRPGGFRIGFGKL